MLSRRNCIATLALSGLSSVALRAQHDGDAFSRALKSIESRTPEDLAQDESFWSAVRTRFEVVADNSNLVTVVRGVAPTATRLRVAEEYERLNSFRLGGTPNAARKAASRQKAAAFIGAPDNTVALVRNTTEGVTTVLMNWPLQPGDEILTSSAEHGAFYDTLAARAARDGIVVRRFHYPAPAPTLDAVADAVEQALTPRTKLVMVGQVVLTGQITPVRAIAERVHARGAKLLVDGVLGVGHVPTDVRAMDCDFYAAGFHKFACGPRATAVFYVRPELVERLPPLFGAMDEEKTGQQKPLWNQPVINKYERTGAHPDAHYYALGDSLDFLSSIGVERIRARLFALTARWLRPAQGLAGFRSVVRPDPIHCAGLVAWEFEGRRHEDVRAVLTKHQLLVGGTESYSGFFHIPADRPRSLFIANTALFTSPSDVDRLLTALRAVATG
jgi:selenocysteine lyase/cysteine desulfurase